MRFILLILITFSFEVYSQNSVLAEGDWIKVSINKSGVYIINQAFLKKNSISIKNIDPQKIRVFVGNIKTLPQANTAERIKDLVEMPVWCNDLDRKLDTKDQVLFYAESTHEEFYDGQADLIKHQLNAYSNESYYFINIGSEDAKIIETLPKSTTKDLAISSLTHFFYDEKESKNLLSSGRQWFGDFFYNSLNYEIKTPNAISPIKINMRILGVGRSDQALDLKINNQSLAKYVLPRSSYNATDNYARYNRFANLTDIEQIELKTSNIINLSLNLSTEGSANAGAYVDYYEIQYERSLIYDSKNQIQYWYLKSKDETNFSISQSDQNTAIWQINNPFLPQKFDLQSNGKFGTNLNGKITKIIVFNIIETSEPVFIEKLKNQNINNSPTPNLIVVYPEKFKDEVQRFIIYKKQLQNLDVLGISTQEIYNEYSSGKVDPTAIRDMCRQFWNKNKSALKYLLLIGDASFDYKNNNQFSFVDTKNMVPTYQSKESLEPIYSFSSDDYFGFLEDFEGEWKEGYSQKNNWVSNRDNDHTLDIAVGRLPAKTLFEAKSVINKIINYQNATVSSGEWKNKITLVADNRDYNIHQQGAESLSQLSKQSYGGFEIEKIYLDQFPITTAGTSPAANEALNIAISDGTAILNYSGHGSEDGWANEKLLTIGDIQNFRNSTRLPIFFTATCQFGKFDNPSLVSGAELALLNPSGGCIAILTTTRPVYSITNERINKAFYSNITKVKTLGDLFVLTKNQAIDGEINRNFSLLGDPSQLLPEYQNKVELSLANGKEPLGQTWGPMEKIKISGKTVKPMNGKIKITIYDKPEKKKTLGTFSDGPAFEFEASDKKLFEGLYNLNGGLFNGNIILPIDQVPGKGRGLMTFYAVNQDSTENAYGFFNDFTLTDEISKQTDDKMGPEIKISIIPNQTLKFDLFDESGINISSFNKNHESQIVINDTLVISATNLLQSLQSGLEASISYYVGNLPSGKHTVKLIVFDNNNNKSEKTFNFNIEKPKFAIINYSNYPNPFSNYTNLIFKHNRLGHDIIANLVIYDIFGNTVKTQQKTCKKCEDKIEFGLEFEGNTNVSPQLYYKINLLALSENEYTQTSGRLIFWK